MKIPFNILLGFLVFSITVSAETIDPKSFAGRSEMEGYKLSDYGDFQKNWHLVTTRFRKDTGELRFTYANEIAWEALTKGSTDFPDGAVFAKTGIATHDDPAFPSSAVPSGARRFQLMVRNKKKHATTDGWGYALFDQKGLTFPEDPKQTVQACAACHRLVPERGFVFSQIMQMPPVFTTTKNSESADHRAAGNHLEFKDLDTKELPDAVRKELPPGTSKIRSLQGSMRKHLFQGTLDEIRPTLATEAVRSGLPVILLSQEKDRFSIVFKGGDKSCAEGSTSFKGVHPMQLGNASNTQDSKKSERYEISFCH